MNPTYLALLFAVLAPFVFGFMNILDKYVVSKKVKYTSAYTILAGFAVLVYGIITSLFLDWNIDFRYAIYPIISGAIFGAQYYFYYWIFKKEDASNVIGLYYAYPIFVAVLSFIVLNERLSLVGYLAMIMIIIGSLMLSINIKKNNTKKLLFFIFILIILVAVYEFLIKITVNNMPQWNGIALEFISIGLMILCGLVFNGLRFGIKKEIKNLKWAFFIESLTILGIALTFFAANQLKITVISAIASIQPLIVLFYERTLSGFFGGLHKKEKLISKLIPICLIVIGVIILSLQEVI